MGEERGVGGKTTEENEKGMRVARGNDRERYAGSHTLITRMLYACWWDTYVWALVSKLCREGIHEYRGSDARVLLAETSASRLYCPGAVSGLDAAGKLRLRRIKLKPEQDGTSELLRAFTRINAPQRRARAVRIGNACLRELPVLRISQRVNIIKLWAKNWEFSEWADEKFRVKIVWRIMKTRQSSKLKREMRARRKFCMKNYYTAVTPRIIEEL